MERLLEHTRHQRRLAHGHGPLGDGLGDRFDIDGLEVFLVQTRARRLACDSQNRNRVGLCGVQTGDHVGARGARGADAHADVARLRAGVALGHVRRAFHMAREHVADAAGFAHRRVERVDRGARHAERGIDAFFFEHQNGGVDGSHFGHECLLKVGNYVG
ncbi:hypothetical protein OKW30_002145 [Paraburkholderia sp. Clong3]